MSHPDNLPAGPLSIQTMKEQMAANNNFVEGKVVLELKEIIESNFEDFLDLLSERLTHSYCLADTSYSIIGHTDTTITFHVRGEAAYCLDERENEASYHEE